MTVHQLSDFTDPEWLRFVAKCEPTPTGCIRWTASLNDSGYGQFRTDGGRKGSTVVKAHVYAWRRKRGPVPDGLELDHTCRNRWCVNDDHCEPVTKVVNIMRGESPPAQNARKTVCPLGHPYDALNPTNGGRECSICKKAGHRAYLARIKRLAS